MRVCQFRHIGTKHNRFSFIYTKRWCRGPESNRYGSHLPQDFKSCASASSATPAGVFLEEATGFEPVDKGFADLGLTTWLCLHLKIWSGQRDSNSRPRPWQGRALPTELCPQYHTENITLFQAKRNNQWLGYLDSNQGMTESKSVALPLGYTPKWGDRWESNPRMSEPQSDALTTSPRPPQILMAGAVGIEPTLEVLETSVLPLNYAPIFWWRGTDSNRRTHRERIYSPPRLATSLPLHTVVSKRPNKPG